MNAFMDVIIAMFMGGMLLLMALGASERGVQEFFNQNSDAIVQRNLTQTSNIMQFDMRKIGFQVPETKKDSIIITAAPDHFKYLAQLNFDADSYLEVPGVTTYDSIPDTMEYSIILDETFNFTDTTIYTYNIIRTIKLDGETPYNSLIGTIGNNDVFEYLDQIGRPVGVTMATRMVEMTLTAYNPRVILSPEHVMTHVGGIADSTFRKRELRRILRASYWRQTRLVSKNLRR